MESLDVVEGRRPSVEQGQRIKPAVLGREDEMYPVPGCPKAAAHARLPDKFRRKVRTD
jgi:hypothetical protein